MTQVFDIDSILGRMKLNKYIFCATNFVLFNFEACEDFTEKFWYDA